MFGSADDSNTKLKLHQRNRFNFETMMKANLELVDIVVLTSLCWDIQTRNMIAHRLVTELPLGAIVIDYQETFAEFDYGVSCCFYKGVSSAMNNGSFILEHVCDASCSWYVDQPLYVYKKRYWK